MKDFDDRSDAKLEATPGIVARKGQRRGESHDPLQTAADPGALVTPELSHPANAAPLANLLGSLQHSHGNSFVQRVVGEVREAGSETPPERSAGQLEASTRTQMEAAFGEDFGDVRVHTGSDAEKLNQELNARAVTRGRDIYFAAGEYHPATREGQELLAHELTHVVQQRDAPSGLQTAAISQPGDRFEQEADASAQMALSGQRVPPLERSAGAAWQRQTRGSAQMIPGAIDLKQQPHGALAGGVTYGYDAGAHQLTLTGPPQMSVSAVQGGQIIFDSAHAAMTVARTRTITIRITGTPLSLTVNGTVFRMVP